MTITIILSFFAGFGVGILATVGVLLILGHPPEYDDQPRIDR